MAYVIDPHLAYSDRLARLLRQSEVPQKNCKVNDVWLAFIEATKGYLLWPSNRTAYRFEVNHEDSQQGPITVVKWVVYFEHVNRHGVLTAVSFTQLSLETPMVLAWCSNSVIIKSNNFASLTDWLRAVQTDPLTKHIAHSNVRWKRKLSAKFIE